MELTPSDSLGSMSLHDISKVYGTEGLRSRFDLEVQRFTPEEQVTLFDACELALWLHEGQERAGGQPHADHLLRVATRIMSPAHYGSNDVDLIVAALLHDSVEDQATRLVALGGDAVPPGPEVKEAALRVIERRYNPDVAMTVRAVTNPPLDKSGDNDWRADYRRHVQEMLLLHPKAKVIKISDYTDNGIGINYSPPERLEHFAEKYAPLTSVFRELIMLPDTPLSDAAKQLILSQLDAADERFGVILRSKS